MAFYSSIYFKVWIYDIIRPFIVPGVRTKLIDQGMFIAHMELYLVRPTAITTIIVVSFIS